MASDDAAAAAVGTMFHELPLRVAPQETGDPLAVSVRRTAAATGAPPSDDASLLLEADPAVRQLVAIERLTKRLRQIAMLQLLLTVVLVGFFVALLVGIFMFLSSLSDAVDRIAETLTPATLQAMVTGVQSTIDTAYDSAVNLFHLSESSESLGAYMLSAMNSTAALLERANSVGSRLLEHPVVQLSLNAGDGA